MGRSTPRKGGSYREKDLQWFGLIAFDIVGMAFSREPRALVEFALRDNILIAGCHETFDEINGSDEEGYVRKESFADAARCIDISDLQRRLGDRGQPAAEFPEVA